MWVDDKLAKEKQLFLEWFTANYPPRCIISNPAWHADKIYRTARKLIRNTDLTDCQPQKEQKAMNEHSSGTRADVPPSATGG